MNLKRLQVSHIISPSQPNAIFSNEPSFEEKHDDGWIDETVACLFNISPIEVEASMNNRLQSISINVHSDTSSDLNLFAATNEIKTKETIN